MAEYLVTWEIDVTADTVEAAALAALVTQMGGRPWPRLEDPDAATVFVVTDKASGKSVSVDLSSEVPA